jgi:hypothetical protein
MSDSAFSLDISGILSAPLSGGYFRVSAGGEASPYVGVPQANLLSPLPLNPTAGQPISLSVMIESQLALSDYGLPSQTVAISTAPGGAVVVVRPPSGGSSGGYFASDGTQLQPEMNGPNVVGFSGTGRDGHAYALSTDSWIVNGPGRVAGSTFPWVGARISLTQDSDSPLSFGFSYCPSNALLSVFIERGNVSTWVRADFSPAIGGAGSGAYANLTRFFAYYDHIFSTQTATMPVGQLDPHLYLPAMATLWPFLKRVGFFEPTLSAVSNASATTLPPLQTTPAAALGTLDFKYPAPPLATFLASTTMLVGPAIGPFVAEFVSPNEPYLAALTPAAKWLGAMLVSGVGKSAFLQEITDYYNYMVENAGTLQPNFGPSVAQLPKEIAPPPDQSQWPPKKPQP